MTILITVPGLLEPSNKALALQASAIQLSTVKITDQSGYDRVASSLRDVATIRGQIEDLYKPVKKERYDAHQAACGAERESLAPVLTAQRIFERMIAEYEEDMKRLQARQEIEARRLAQEQDAANRAAAISTEKEFSDRQLEIMLEEATTLDEAKAIMSQRTTLQAAAVERVKADPPPPPLVHVPPAITKAPGVPTKTVYTVTVTNLKSLVNAVAMGEFPLTFLEQCQSALDKYATLTEGKTEIPGCLISADTKVTGRKRTRK